MESYVVIGGEGFLGHNIILMLIQRYPQSVITSVDIVQRHFPEKNQWAFISADLTNLESLSDAFGQAKATCVFHTASPWLATDQALCEKVNVLGTKTVVEACTACSVGKLVFTSSSTVSYNGEDVINLDERAPYADPPLDHYATTKAKAEKIVLNANGKGGLLTCALRPSGILGPGDRQATPGFISVYKNNQTNWQIGDNTNLFEFTYVDNVVHAHLLAAEKLGTSVPVSSLSNYLGAVAKTIGVRKLPTSAYRPDGVWQAGEVPQTKGTNGEIDAPLESLRTRFDQFSSLPEDVDEIPVAGQAYFITNGEPAPFWDFARAHWWAYADHEPGRIITLPVGIAYYIGYLAEWWAKMVGKEPGFTPSRVKFATSHRFFNIDKARRMLGYEPLVGIEEGIRRTVEWYKQNEVANHTAAKAKS